MGMQDLKQELQAITPEQMERAVVDTSWKIGPKAEGENNGIEEEFLGLMREYPGLATAIHVMVEADMAHGRSKEEADRNALSGAWAFLALKQLIDTDELRRSVEG